MTLKLNLEKVNATSPYAVTMDEATHLYKFASDYGVSFSVAFEKNDLFEKGVSYQFVLTNYEGKKSLRDVKVRETILAIVEEFFHANEAALLYICETGDGMQRMRNRLFLFWFGIYGEREEYVFLPQTVTDDEGNENYAALIIRRDNPCFADLVAEFMETINLLNIKPGDDCI